MAIDLRTGEVVCKTPLADRSRVARDWHEVGADMHMSRHFPTSRRARRVLDRRAAWNLHRMFMQAGSWAVRGPDSWTWNGSSWVEGAAL